MGAVVLGLAAVIAGAWLLTLDLHADDRRTDGSLAGCGSAYDVALFEHDGYMGGEIAPNQGAIDRQCVQKAWGAVALGGVVGLGGAAAAGYVLTRPAGRPRSAAAAPLRAPGA